ncbi:vWA domain-containing protein [Cellvibrio japonicus]|uniref:von Willebrand factor type A domain protein n=1 Tax=Cellvibrio japonicus (strain Ueda107) TaxID=498211 RepID=B3PBW0_CELJU|nr:VWA domain-containing protein [Cellvibrio japonicus]ACE83777.1 von Willebrand factor type A domain protein [Cellvibrio japonicus Ueda107]QEI11776.1 VWA domain-containing protein [Cellvibrio japonicus]QEI15350.1 VWA domain-containing protein [Cellvibrio japonicus]QEI18930.1 VWA domain-containing protein [Cellvibrio japonicus]
MTQSPEKHPLDELATLNATPNATIKARHIAAALEAFSSEPSAAADEKTSATEKISAHRQGFLQRLRLTRESTQHGNDTMKNSTHNPHPFWKRPALLSGIAASSIAVIAGLGLMQHYQPGYLATPPMEAHLADTHSDIEEIVVTGMRAELSQAEERQHKAKAIADRQRRMAEAQMAAKPMAAAPTAAVHADAYAPADILQATTREYRDRFNQVDDNPVIATRDNPFSTFSIDVDTAAYSFTRRLLNQGQLPPKDAVRIEEMVNYFDYSYPLPSSAQTPFTTNITVLDSPWKPGNKLLHIGIQGYQLPAGHIPQSNLVFLLDVSGSMDEPSKLPLVKQSMELLLSTLKPEDTVAIVVYAGAAGTVLEPTKVREKSKILAALHNLQAGGSTAGGEGLALAYQLAEANFNPKGVNRIILATDGDFNVGQTGDEPLQDFVERKRAKGIYLSVLGFGQGNYQDALMQTLAQNGNGTAAYIDTLSEAQKVLVNEATSTLFPIARDVKIQVEFNPATVAEYRLLGYETRALKREDFANDKVDAGDVGSGQRVTAIYEITPVGTDSGLLEAGRYQTPTTAANSSGNEYGLVRLRYKLPTNDKSQLLEQPVLKNNKATPELQQEARFATAVAGFAQLLKGGKYTGDFTYDQVIELAQANKGNDEYGYRTEFVQLVRKAKIAREL